MCKSVWKNAVKGVCWLILATFVYTATAQARVCFLPGGKCPGAPLANTLKGIQGDQCLGYNLTQIKCKDQACEIGWDCESCTNAQGTFYKCTKKPTPPGFTPGLEKCPSPCQQYTWDGFTGNQINGKCDSIPDYTPTKPNPCRSYLTPDYTCGASISGADVGDLTKENGGCQVCYTNIVEMSGYTTTKPASCTTYNSKRNGLGSNSDTMCYTSGTSIGEHFTTAERDSDAFIVETKYGVDTFIALSGAQTKKNTEACYRATGCNTANGWLKSTDVDGNKFEYLEKSSDGIVCRKAIACKESNNWFNHEKLGQYKNKHFSTTEETRSGLTCYRAGGCHTKAYTAQPDARYFKFDKKTSNSYNCWIVTGKADYAYNAGDKKTNMFDYTSATVYLNGTDTQVTYWIVNKDNGRNGCMQYAYESQPDTRYFTTGSAIQYSNGSSTTKTCWNITGKAAYAYNTGDRKTNFFDYTSATGYLNGTGTQVTYWIVNKDNGRRGCMQYAYENQPDASYFASTSATHYSNGSSTTKTCWNATGKATYVYAANEKQTAYFAYDSGATAYLNGTSTTGTYYKVTGCASGASTSTQDTSLYVVDNKTQYKNGSSSTLKCYHPLSCNVGYKQASASNAYGFNCTACPIGTYNATAGSTTCTNCPAGTYNNSTTQTSSSACKTCEAGTYAPAGSSGCTACGAETYALAGSGSCSACPNKPALSEGCGCAGTHTRTATCNAKTGAWTATDWTTCAGESNYFVTSRGCGCAGSEYYYCLSGWDGICHDQSNYYVTSRSCGCAGSEYYYCLSGWDGTCHDQSDYYTGNYTSQGCGCGGTQYKYHYCLSGWGGWGSCDGQSDYATTSQGCGCGGTQYHYCLSGWGGCGGQSDYYVTSESTSSGCSCGATKSHSYYCLSGWGGYGNCSGGSNYEVDSSSTSCGCGGTKTKKKYCQTGWGDYGSCSKSDCSSGYTCTNGTCVKNCSDTCPNGYYKSKPDPCVDTTYTECGTSCYKAKNKSCASHSYWDTGSCSCKAKCSSGGGGGWYASAPSGYTCWSCSHGGYCCHH